MQMFHPKNIHTAADLNVFRLWKDVHDYCRFVESKVKKSMFSMIPFMLKKKTQNVYMHVFLNYMQRKLLAEINSAD